MHEPTPAALLGGVIASLRADVLPALEVGAPQRQLKAALVILGRLQRAADHESLYLEQDAADVVETLRGALGHEPASVELAQRIAAIESAPVGSDLVAARARDTELQALAIDVEEHLRASGSADGTAALRRLHHRMLARQDRAWGTGAPVL